MNVRVDDAGLEDVGRTPGSAKRRRTRQRDGSTRTTWDLDFASDTMVNDLTYVFRQSVLEARRENKRVTGYASGVPGRP